jgi:single-strand DNA-binding protein
MLNHIVIHGRLTQDPELKQTPSGVSVVSFSVAVDRAYRSGEDKQTDFFTVVCWRGLADMVSKYFSKGKEIVVSGEMQSRKWQDKDGNNRIAWELNANTVDFCGSKADSAPAAHSVPSPAPKMQELAADADLPF